MTRQELAFARVFSNYLLGGTAAGALIALMGIWLRDQEYKNRGR